MFDYSIKQVWESKVSQEDFSSMLNLEGKPTKLDQLKRLCDCAVSFDWGRRTVTVGANDTDTLEMVIRRLDRVAEYYQRQFTPIVAHCVNVEEKTKFVLKFVSFANQSGRARTTFFDNGSKWNAFALHQLFSVRLLEYDYKTYKYKSCKVEAGLVQTAYKTSEHSDWAGYVFCTREAVGLPSTSHTDIILDEIREKRQIALEDMICVYHLPLDAPPGTVHGDSVIETDDAAAASRVVVAGAKRHPRIKCQGDDASVTTSSSSPREDIPAKFFVGPNQSASGYQPSVNSAKPASAPWLDLGLRPTSSDGANTDSGTTTHPVEQNTSTGTILGALPADPADVATTSGTSRRPRERGPAPESVGGFLLGPPPASQEESDTIGASRRPRERGPAPESVGGFLLGPPPAGEEESDTIGASRRPRERRPVPTAKAEKTEDVAEPTTRTLRYTVNQKMPNNPDIDTFRKQTSKRINETLFHALEHARGWHGELKLEAKVGRLIYLDIPRKIVKQDLDWQKWDSILNKSDELKIKSTFTRIVTTQHFDMEYIRDLKITGGEEVFSTEPISRKVTWEFELEQRGKKRTLCVDGETFQATLYGDKKNFGAVNIANPLHSWDYRVELVGKKPMDINSDQFIKHVYDSISSTVSGGLPEISFSIDGPSLVVKRVLLKCETRHSVYLERYRRGVPMELVCTEVQETQLSCRSDTDKRYKACILTKNKMRQNAKLHYTCSIIPSDANALMKANLNLDVGEMADWSSEQVLRLEGQGGGLLLPSLMSVLNQVVQKLDDVGSSNSAFL